MVGVSRSVFTVIAMFVLTRESVDKPRICVESCLRSELMMSVVIVTLTRGITRVVCDTRSRGVQHTCIHAGCRVFDH